MKPRVGFTLIELLVVMAILIILSGMIMPVVSLARQRSAITNTESLMRKVETGLELFHGEMDTYPYQKHETTESFPEADNRLVWFLATTMTKDDRDNLDADLSAIRDAYMEGNAHYVSEADVDPQVSNQANSAFHRYTHAAHVNRVATERASIAIVAGNSKVPGILAKRSAPILSDPKSKGLAIDFISVDLNKRDIRGETLVDFWGNPLIYNCPAITGIRPFYSGQAHAGRRGDEQENTPVNPLYYGMGPVGRTATDTLAGDQRTTAAEKYVYRYELWSAGPDGQVDAERTAGVNRDNRSPTDYWRGLQ